MVPLSRVATNAGRSLSASKDVLLKNECCIQLSIPQRMFATTPPDKLPKKLLPTSRFSTKFPSLAFLVAGVVGLWFIYENKEKVNFYFLKTKDNYLKNGWSQLLKDQGSRELVAYSISSDPKSCYRFLIYSLIKKNEFSPEDVREFSFILIQELLSDRAYPTAKENVAEWLFLLRDHHKEDYICLLQKLQDAGTLDKLLRPDNIWFYGVQQHVVGELKYDISQYVTQTSV